MSKFSPQAWGCTAPYHTAPLPLRVFPTGVGVYRMLLTTARITNRFPHRRGGVPNIADDCPNHEPFSPQAWGCTVWRSYQRRHLRRFPHRRGGVPGFLTITHSWAAFSPQAWGCTDGVSRQMTMIFVFPTGVGVYRREGEQ